MSLSKEITSNDLLYKVSFSSASSLMALQLFSRIFTFILNQALFRMVSPRVYGTAAIQFELMLSTILFLSREGIRNALLRVQKRRVETANISFLPVLFGLPLAFATSYFYARFAGEEVKSQAYFNTAIGIYALAALTELLSEPLHNLAMAELRTSIRVRAEGAGITAKTFVTFFVLWYDVKGGKEGALGLLAFAGGQMAYSTFVLSMYIMSYGIRNIWPKNPQIKYHHFFEPEILRLSLTMTSQSLIKHCLTEGDKLILSWFSPLKDQGGYAIGVNYGSLLARIVFQPLEETLRVYFSRTLGHLTRSSTNGSIHGNLHQAANTLTSLLSVQSAFSVFLLVFGTAYMPILVQILLPQQYISTSAPSVLSAWVWYIPVIAFNGGLEAFVSSVATPEDLNKQSRWMAVFSAVYILSAIMLYKLNVGDTSLIYANILNLSMRILYSAHFITWFFTSHDACQAFQWKSILPKWPVWTIACISLGLIHLVGRMLGVSGMTGYNGTKVMIGFDTILYLGLGVFLGLGCLSTWWTSSGRYLSIAHHFKAE